MRDGHATALVIPLSCEPGRAALSNDETVLRACFRIFDFPGLHGRSAVAAMARDWTTTRQWLRGPYWKPVEQNVAPVWFSVSVDDMRLYPLIIKVQPTALGHSRRRLERGVVHDSTKEVPNQFLSPFRFDNTITEHTHFTTEALGPPEQISCTTTVFLILVDY